ncbi:MAG: HEAT repeat domain-containing protein, partial [Saprospiraceae bacterium]
MISEIKTTNRVFSSRCITWIGFALGVFSSCIPIKKDNSYTGEIDLQTVTVDFKDSTIRGVLTAQNDQYLNGLYSYLHSPLAAVRYTTALALGSVRDSLSADTLANLLNDQNIYVASAAAYSLGVIGAGKSQSALLGAFRQYDTSGINSPLNGAILESIGKLGTLDFLHAMATVETYKPSDTLLLLGQIRGIYRYMLRGITDGAGTSTAVKYLSDQSFPHEVRLMSAHYMARGKNLDLSSYAAPLVNVYNSETNLDVKLPLILAMGKTKSDAARSLIVATIEKNEDER